MQPLISAENVDKMIDVILEDLPSWRKGMIHYIKEENPELNTAIIEISQKTDLDPKALATGATFSSSLSKSTTLLFASSLTVGLPS